MFKINFELEFGLSAGQRPNLNGSTVKSDERVPMKCKNKMFT